MKNSGTRTRSTLGLAGFLLVLVAALGAQAAPPASKLPGRKPDSREPWDAFLGKAAHYAIGRAYSVQHPTNRVFLDTVDLYDIVEKGRLGDPERLSALVRLLRPDITDTFALVLFEVKPDNEQGLKEGREQAGRYLAALNEAVEPDKKLVGGTGFEGSLFLEFENGGALWLLMVTRKRGFLVMGRRELPDFKTTPCDGFGREIERGRVRRWSPRLRAS